MKRNIALMCDYGLDDALATLYLFEHRDMFEKIDILAISGNFLVEDTFVNTKRLLSNIAPEKTRGVRIVDTRRVAQKGTAIPEIHGNDGMGDVLPMEYDDSFEVIQYDEWLNELDSSYTVLSVGPCSVTIDILNKKGELPLIMMAGNIAEPPNYNGYEFNHGIDLEAFAETVKYPHVIATLDTCHSPYCNLRTFDYPKEGIFGKMLNRYFELCDGRGEEVISVYDLTAIVYLIYPDRFTVESRVDKLGNKLNVLKYIAEKPII